MNSISTSNNQIQCFYSSGTPFSDKLEAFLKSTKKDTLAIDITKTMPSDTMWHDIADKLNTSLKDLIALDDIQETDDSTSFSEESLVKILAKNPKALKGAIIIENDTIAHITNYTEVLKFYDVDSAGLEKTFHTDQPVSKSQTDDDTFV
ncbi:hypothetical protein [Olleya sp. YS]|uniref:arsenate reductase family protein n=1 Tax=Olleya sp. YS TaxID=3028318 RepID=UPI002434122A|nr:hypothetical protein [Olleya sp. YS]WGD34529.1 hypothetical protein Ollyesu_12160 [Olleya sp. YS]